MLGFPIRTPPDHSLVANSPGLIAGSNVLHRLLMPRHPPCALHSLSQQRQNNTRHPHKHTKTKRGRTHTVSSTPFKTRYEKTPPAHPNQRHASTHIHNQHHHRQTPTTAWLQRCSRPLCRSQTTTPPTPSTTHRQPRAKGGTESPTTHHPKTVKITPGAVNAADPSGPNSVLDPTPTNAGPG